MGTHEKPNVHHVPVSHRKVGYERKVRNWCRKHDSHLKWCLSIIGAFLLDGSSIVFFEWFHPIVVHSPHITAIAAIVARW